MKKCLDFGFFKKKDDYKIINEAKEKFVDNVIDFLKEVNKDEHLLNNVIDLVKRNNSIKEQYENIVKETLETAVEEFTVEDGRPLAILGYTNTNFNNAEKCLHKILREYPSELEEDYRFVIFFTISYLETVCRNYSNEFVKKIIGKKMPDSFETMFWNSMDFYQSWMKLIQSDNITHLENFAKKFIDSGIIQEEISKLNQLIQYKELQIDTNIVRKIVEQIQLSIKRDRLESGIMEKNPQTLTDYLDTYFEIHGEKHLENIEALRELLKKKEIYYEGTIRQNVDAHKKHLEMTNYAQSLRDPIRKKSYSLQMIDQMSGYEFEEFLKDLFERMGYDVELTKGSGDQGADLILSKMGEKTVVQAKQYSYKVPNTAVQEISAAIKHYRAYHGMVVSSNDFQPSAIELADSNGIQLVNRKDLSDWINTYL